MADILGITGTTNPKRLTPPEGLEAVHTPGDTWPVQGLTDSETTHIGVDQWAYLIGLVRGLTFIDDLDLSDIEPGDPFLLREIVRRAIVAKFDADIDGIVSDNAQEIADLLEPLLLSEGLPARLGTVGESVTDVNNVFNNGTYQHDTVALNGPIESSFGIFTSISYDANWAFQRWYHIGSDAVYRRRKYSGALDGWKLIQETREEQDARYGQLATPNNWANGQLFEGQATARNAFAAASANASYGYMLMRPGDASGSGYLEFNTPGNARAAWFGYVDVGGRVNLVMENGTTGLTVSNGDIRVGADTVRTTGNTQNLSVADGQAAIYTGDKTVRADHLKEIIEYHGGKLAEVGRWDYSSPVTYVDFTGLAGYREIRIIFDDLVYASATPLIRVSTDNGASFASSGYKSGAYNDGTGVTNTTGIPLTDGAYTFFDYGTLVLDNFSIATRKTNLLGLVHAWTKVGGKRDVAEANNALRFYVGANITGGSITILGRK